MAMIACLILLFLTMFSECETRAVTGGEMVVEDPRLGKKRFGKGEGTPQ
jgi:hypothetical protein